MWGRIPSCDRVLSRYLLSLTLSMVLLLVTANKLLVLLLSVLVSYSLFYIDRVASVCKFPHAPLVLRYSVDPEALLLSPELECLFFTNHAGVRCGISKLQDVI